MAARLLCRVVSRAPVLAFRASLPSTALDVSSCAARRAALCSWSQRRRLAARRPALLQPRFASGSAGLTAADLQEGLLNTLKLFDKVDPDKVASSSAGRALLCVGWVLLLQVVVLVCKWLGD